MPQKNDASLSRRALLRDVASACLGMLVVGRVANATTGEHHVDETDPQARALGYTQDVANLDPKSHPQFKSGASCSSCLQVRGSNGEAWRPCIMFPGKLVNANGWCKGWVRNPRV